jgi:preprotein translocase subunit Sss1
MEEYKEILLMTALTIMTIGLTAVVSALLMFIYKEIKDYHKYK